MLVIDYGYAANKKKLINNQIDLNKQRLKMIYSNNKYKPNILITITHLIDSNYLKNIKKTDKSA